MIPCVRADAIPIYAHVLFTSSTGTYRPLYIPLCLCSLYGLLSPPSSSSLPFCPLLSPASTTRRIVGDVVAVVTVTPKAESPTGKPATFDSLIDVVVIVVVVGDVVVVVAVADAAAGIGVADTLGIVGKRSFWPLPSSINAA